ncbi:MAG: dual specificity protein phosphatase family protein [Cyanobacteria bacterium J06627_8]
MNDQSSQPITETLWWIVPKTLAGVRKPARDELYFLQSQGVGAIVSVLDDPSNLDIYQELDLPYLWLPVKGGTPPDHEQVTQLNQFVTEQMQLGRGVAVHCTNGKRRTGTMLATYLIKNGASFDAAMSTIHSVKPEIELREAQIAFLRDLSSD